MKNSNRNVTAKPGKRRNLENGENFQKTSNFSVTYYPTMEEVFWLLVLEKLS